MLAKGRKRRLWRRARSLAATVVAVMLALPALALAHLERPSYWPDPAPDTSVTPPAGGMVPEARSLKSAPSGAGPGDVLVVYSDGVSEAVNPSGEEFGPTRLYEVVARNLDASAGGIRDRIESALTKFCQGTPAADDITLVIVKRNAEAGEAVSGAAS